MQKKVDRLICKSLEYAFENYPIIPDFVKQHSQEMSEQVMRKHIDLHVNDFSLDLGESGMKVVEQMLNVCKNM